MRKKERSFIDKLFLILKGIAMGTANKVPGVSGGVVAFVMGFYDEFIFSLQQVNKTAFSLLFKGEFKLFYRTINGSFLTFITLGTLISFFSVSRLIDYLLISHELYVWSTFFGMIIGSVYFINKDFQDWSQRNLLVLFIGIAIGVAISIPDPIAENKNIFFVFFCGMISTSGIALPGLSGSFILMLLGNYVLLLVDAVNALSITFSEIIVGDYSFLSNSERLELLWILIVFTVGSVAGLVFLSHLLGFVLKKHKKTTYAIIIGFILGSLGVVWPWKKDITTPEGIIIGYKRYLPDLLHSEDLIAMGYICIGILIVVVLEVYGKRKK